MQLAFVTEHVSLLTPSASSKFHSEEESKVKLTNKSKLYEQLVMDDGKRIERVPKSIKIIQEGG